MQESLLNCMTTTYMVLRALRLTPIHLLRYPWTLVILGIAYPEP